MRLRLITSVRSMAIFIKRTVSRDFRPYQTIPLQPWFTGWSRFAYGIVFAEKIYTEIAKIGFCNRFRSLNEIHCLLEAAGFDPAVSMTSRDGIPRFQLHCWIRSRGFNDTAGSDPTVSMTPRESLWHRGIIRENDYRYWLWFPLQGNHSKNK
jgi:hypothetical protein